MDTLLDMVISALAMAIYVYRNRESDDSIFVGFIVGILFGKFYIMYVGISGIIDTIMDKRV